MDTMEDWLYKYREALKQILRNHGIKFDSQVTDEWILDQIIKLFGKEDETTSKEQNP